MEVNYPLKFNHTSLKDVSFCQMVRDFWPSVSIPEGLNEMDSLVFKLKKLKSTMVDWIKRKVMQENNILISTEKSN